MSHQQTEPRQRRSWTAAEDSILYHEVKRTGIYQGTSNDWNAVAAKLPRRTNKDCRKRWLKICKLVNKGTWSTEEDERLLAAIEEHGQSWIQVAQSVETRHADQCAKRWHTVLCQSDMVSTQAWSGESDEYLLHAVELYGRKWRLIAEQYFSGRSAADVRSRHIALTGHPTHEGREVESSTPSIDLSGLDMESFFEGDRDISFDMEQDPQAPLDPEFDPMASCQQILADFTSQASQPVSVNGTILDPQPEESYTTLVLTNVQPSTLGDVMNILMRDRVKVSMSLNGT